MIKIWIKGEDELDGKAEITLHTAIVPEEVESAGVLYPGIRILDNIDILGRGDREMLEMEINETGLAEGEYEQAKDVYLRYKVTGEEERKILRDLEYLADEAYRESISQDRMTEADA